MSSGTTDFFKFQSRLWRFFKTRRKPQVENAKIERKMDFMENTLKVVGNLNTFRENRAQLQEGQKQYEDYIEQLKENLQKVQSFHSQNKEILEGNTLTKTIYNENCKVMQELFRKIYNCTQEIDENISKIIGEEKRLKEHCREIQKQYQALVEKKDKKLRDIEIIGNNTIKKLMEENSELQQNLNQLKTLYSEMEEDWKCIIDEQDEKKQELQAIILQNELLTDQIESQQKEEEELVAEIESKREETQKELEDINNEVETILDEITESKKSRAETLQQLQQQQKLKEELEHQEQEELMTLQKLKKECSDIENRIAETEDKSAKEIEELTAMIESKTKLNDETLTELQTCKEKFLERSTEIDELRLKITSLDEENATMARSHKDANTIQTETLIEIENIKTENEQLDNDYVNLTNDVSDYNKQISEEEKRLDEIRSVFQLELMQTNERQKELELNFLSEKTKLENELNESELQNKQLQQSRERMEKDLEELKFKQLRLTIQKGQNQQTLKNFQNQSRIVSNEIKRCEAAKAENTKLMPKPPLKKPIRPAIKRSLTHLESDSSLDGEVGYTHAEIMAKKRRMEGANKKRQKI